MAPPASVLSQTLQSISLTKIREIENQRDKYEFRKNEVLAAAAKHPDDVHKRIAELLRGVADLYPEALGDHKVKNIRCWLQQSKYDPSMPAEILQSSEEVLRSKLEVQSRKLGLAHLYSRLVTEWMNSTTPMDEAAAVPDDASFEVVDRQKERLQELCDKFERVVFEPLEVDEEKIGLYLRDLFDGEDGSKALDYIRRAMNRRSENLLGNKAPFDEATLKWCIKGLLVEDLLSDEKQAILRDFLENSMVLREIADVLNVRYADFESWEWQAGEEGIPVLPRQQLNGKYRIWMDEDVLQAIFIHYVGTNCCISLKETLEYLIKPKHGLWKWQTGSGLTHKEALRRSYYLTGYPPTQDSVDEERRKRYQALFFLSQLPSSTGSWGAKTYDNDGEAEPEGDDDDAPADKRESRNIKQALLHTLATESVMHRSLYGESAVLQSDLQWFATGLSHTTIFAVMRFFGFPEVLTAFFRKVLEAPLNMVPSSGAPPSQGARIRRRGVPMAHAPEKLIGELILFVMDLAVNQETGMLLYRLHDDLFLCGEPPRVAKAWKAMGTMAKVMGLEFNMNKTGSVYLTDDGRSPDAAVAAGLPQGVVRIGHLTLDPASGEWILDQKQVSEHVSQLGKQLAACTSVLDWVKTWNSCVGRFFSHTFGEPAFCFGSQHVDSILTTYQQMQRVLFGGAPNSSSDSTKSVVGEDGNDTLQASVVRHLKSKIEARFGITGVPDAFVLLPEKLGGLGLRNPFIPFLAVREDFEHSFSSAQAVIRTCLDAEKEDYAAARRAFYAYGSVEERLRHLHAGSSRSMAADYEASRADTLGALGPAEYDTFFSFEEYTRWREATSAPLRQAYLKLLEAPPARGPDLDDDVRDVLKQLSISSSDPSPKLQEVRWILQMYGDELRDQCGGLRLVEQKFLPLGLLSMMRRKAVRWNLVL
ncbi:hypothetical protein F4775DRAFT_546072 [Biscogniauxia sp. FL1348]|nr:hypothetical protein F4775DRAFT_546072 [Biscogniauxia sp. FL1348]